VLAKKPENTFVRSMVIQMNHQSSNRLIDAYNQMMASIRSSFETSDNDEMSLSKAMSMARDEITHITDVTQDEAEEISNFIKRDINDAAEYMMESSSEFSDWLMLDITGPGTLQCNSCGHKVSFTTTSQIQDCTECGHSTFKRAEFKEQ
jgi:ABC-type proline/glycine betaine transport system ATPase subunit